MTTQALTTVEERDFFRLKFGKLCHSLHRQKLSLLKIFGYPYAGGITPSGPIAPIKVENIREKGSQCSQLAD